MMESGFVLVDKARGLRSTSCVNTLKKALGRKIKVGHAGTLDSTAEGLLILLFGRMTRTSRYVMALPKTYEVTATLGFETDTLDSEGKVTAESVGGLSVKESDVRRCLFSFLGWICQKPPRISAVRIGGKRAHVLARAGEALSVPERPVYVSSIGLDGFDEKHGTVKFTIACSKGTYVRSVVRDMGRMLETYATVAALKRTAIGPFRISDALSLDALGKDSAGSFRRPKDLAEAFPCYEVPEEMLQTLKSGKAISPGRLLRRHWGICEDSGTVVLAGSGVLSFAKCLKLQEETWFKPETNIYIGEEKDAYP